MRKAITRTRYDRMLLQRTRNAASVSYRKDNVRMMRETAMENDREIGKAKDYGLHRNRLANKTVRQSKQDGRDKVNAFRS